MRTALDISLYPLAPHYRPLIQAFIDRLNAHPELLVETNALSTQIWGELDQVMRILAEEIESAAQSAPQLVFVVKILPTLAPPERLIPDRV
ncbi:MAG TPA: hypothetical protein VKT22_00460 [Steroidobacteraceae bacterium]|nr:hypothetical protein [Steroidobacteraceae bacterium]